MDVKRFFAALDVSESVFAAFLCRQIHVSAGCDVTQTSRDGAANVHAEAPASRSSGLYFHRETNRSQCVEESDLEMLQSGSIFRMVGSSV